MAKVRYESKIPPGYKDADKDKSDDSVRKYGDLIVWFQTIDYAKLNKKSIVFVTDDKKEDWWLEQSGRTISPRPELIEEFQKDTEQKIWMYSVDKFIEYSAHINKKKVDPDIFDEIRKISQQLVSEQLEKLRANNERQFFIKNQRSSIHVSQQTHISDEVENSGVFIITLEQDMRYATGSGKFKPELTKIPQLSIELIEGPEGARENLHISYGCGTTKDFNIHLKAIRDSLPAGDYVFEYEASVDGSIIE